MSSELESVLQATDYFLRHHGALESTNIGGKDGKDGVDGKDGKDGRDGTDGLQGPQGIQGEPGPAGKDGKDGLPGVNGKDGKDGLPGTPGAQGAQGIQGLPGKDGKDGVSVTTATITGGTLFVSLSDGTVINAGKISATTATTTTSGPVMVGGAPNPFAPLIVTSPQGYKAASIDDGIELSLDTLAVQLPTTGSRSLQFRVTSGTMSVNISGQAYWSNGNYGGNYTAVYWNGNTLTTTWQQPMTWSFPWANDKAVYSVRDETNRRYYRVTLIIGPGYKKNFIIMERLV